MEFFLRTQSVKSKDCKNIFFKLKTVKISCVQQHSMTKLEMSTLYVVTYVSFGEIHRNCVQSRV